MSGLKKLLKARKKDPVEIGCALSTFRDNIPTGDWSKVLKKDLGISTRTADRYISAYRRFPKGLDVDMNLSLVFAISKATIPDEVVDLVIEKVKGGEDVSPEEVDKMAEEAGAMPVKLTPGEKIQKHLREAEKAVRAAPVLSCIEREDAEAIAQRIIDWLYAPES